MNEQEDYTAAAQGRIGSDRMQLGLPIIPDILCGDMDKVRELRCALDMAYEILDKEFDYRPDGEATNDWAFITAVVRKKA